MASQDPDLPLAGLGCVANKGVTEGDFGSVASKDLAGDLAEVWQRKELACWGGDLQRIIPQHDNCIIYYLYGKYFKASLAKIAPGART